MSVNAHCYDWLMSLHRKQYKHPLAIHTLHVTSQVMDGGQDGRSSATKPTLSEKKVQKLSLGLYLFKRYTFGPKGCILVP